MQFPAQILVVPFRGTAGSAFEEFWRYFIVSAVALAVDFGLLITLTGVGTAYVGSVRWLFRRRRISSPMR